MTGQPSKVTLKWLDRRIVLTVVLISVAVSACVGLATTALIGSQADSKLRDENNRVASLSRTNGINGCDGTNLLRGDARLLINGLKPSRPDPSKLQDWLLRVRDCPATYDTGRIVIIPPDVEYRYLVALSRRHRVAVRIGPDRSVKLVPMR